MEIRFGKFRRKIKHPLRYVAIALCIVLFVLLNMVIIFNFSAESREESGDRSNRITQLVMDVVYPHYDKLPYNDQINAQENVHYLVRKAAHFLEYALLGFLTSSFMLFVRRFLWKRKIEMWKTWFYPIEFCFLYAVSDEVHQIFSERGPSPKDVLIDTAGALFGILLIQTIVYLVGKLRELRRKNRQGASLEASRDGMTIHTAAAEDADVADDAFAETTANDDGAACEDGDDDGSPMPEGEGESPCALPPTD